MTTIEARQLPAGGYWWWLIVTIGGQYRLVVRARDRAEAFAEAARMAAEHGWVAAQVQPPASHRPNVTTPAVTP
jgi:hypothetical protein